MRPTLQLNSAMSSPPSVAHGRPWTPPDTDSDYFTDPFATDSTASDGLADSWADHELVSPTTSHRPKPVARATDPHYSLKSHKNTDTSAHARDDRLDHLPDVASSYASPPVRPRDARPHLDIHRYPSAPPLYSPMEEHYSRPPNHLAHPHTPVKSLRSPDPHNRNHNGIPQYPYTPDSARTTRTYTHAAPPSPLPPMPWETRTESSPVQSALSSCISHLENLIDTRQPSDDQMEYLVTKFEEMAQFLSAPESQSRQSDDHLFSELDIPSGLGITGANSDGKVKNEDLRIGAGYIQNVGRYIEGVRQNAKDLKIRMDEVKQLNSIQLDIIEDLRKELKSKGVVREEVQEEVQEEVKTEPQKEKQGPLQRMGFWAAIGEALDGVGETLLEW